MRGVITTCGERFSQLKKIFYKCIRCGYLKGPFFPTEKSEIKLSSCYACHFPGPFKIATAKTVYSGHQRIMIQELPS